MMMKLLSTLNICLLSLVVSYGQYEITNYKASDGLVNNVVNCVTVDADDSVWFGTNRGISHYDGTNWTSFTVDDNINLLDEIVTAIYARDNGELWIGTDFGAGVWDGVSFTNYTSQSDLGNLRVQAITEGLNGDMFFGTKGGWARLEADGTWSNFGIAEGLPFGGVKDIEIDEQGTVWAGLGLEGVAIYNYQTGMLTLLAEQLFLNGSVTGIAFSPEKIWISSGGGVDQINIPASSTTAEFIPHPSVFTLPPPHELNQAVDVQVDSKEIIWVGIFIDYLVNVGGISYYEDGVWNSITTDDGLVGPGVNKLAIDSNDCVWVATSTGVSKICAGPSTVSDIISSKVKVYPNPISDVIHIELAQPAMQNLTIGLYNIQGQRIQERLLSQGHSSIRLDTYDLPSGIFTLKVGDHIQLISK